MHVASLIDVHRNRLTPAERRVAGVILTNPQAVAFGTVASLAELTGTSGATVVRMATKLGLDGFAALQDCVRSELAHQLRPDAGRAREASPADVVGKVLAAEAENLHATLATLSRGDHQRAVRRIAEAPGRVLILPGDCARGIGELFADQLRMLRGGIDLLDANPLCLGRLLADACKRDTMVAIDFRRYDRYVLTAVEEARHAGAFLVGCSDSPLSPLAERVDVAFTVAARGAGPFDSQVGTLALVNSLVVGVAAQLASNAAMRLDRIEANWRRLEGA